MAHKKAGGSVKNGRDSVGQRLGVKAGDGQLVNAGTIIVRQRGMTFLAGPGTDLGGDYTLFATTAGKVKFEFATKSKKRVRVIPAAAGSGAGMKAEIHPKYFQSKVHCGSCGREWTVGSTRPELRVDVCGNCHPFYTGTQNIIDTAGQVERFQKRLERQVRA